MRWVIAWALCICIIVNLPLLSMLASQASRSALSALWGYSPHQFFFCLVVFPFACITSLTSLYILVTRLGSDWPEGLRGYAFLQNWPAALLIGVCLSSLVTFADYFSSARSLDKLSPSISAIATRSFQKIDEALNKIPLAQRDGARDDLIQKALQAKRDLNPPSFKDTGEVARWLQGLSPELVVQIVTDASLQRQLKMLDQRTYSLSILQVFVSVFVGTVALFSAAVCFHIIHHAQTSAAIWEARNAAFNAVFFFGFYSICYQQYRNEIEFYGVSGSTTLQQFFVGAIVIGLLIALGALDINKEHVGPQFVERCLPLIIVSIGIGAEIHGAKLLRALIGAKTNWGTQFILAFVIIACGIFVGWQIWPIAPPSTIKP